MKRAISVGGFVVATGAFAVTAFDCAWWLLLGRRGRDFFTELDHYFADELDRLQAVLAVEPTAKGRAA